MRFSLLYMRSRLIIPAIAAVAVAAAIAANSHDPAVAFVAAMLCVVAVAATLAAPDQEWERSLPVRWPRLRAVHLLGAILIVGLILAVALRVPAQVSIRNVIGFAGLGALCAAFLGGRRAWMLLVPYGVAMNAFTRYARFDQPADRLPSWGLAAAAGAAGLAAVAWRGAGDYGSTRQE